MEINNKSIQGIFIYAEDINFEKGDFVVEGDKIYICQADSIGNLPSESPTYFKAYLSDNIATAEDFEKYAKGIGDDKFINAKYLGKILNHYMSGFDEKGIISNTIISNGSNQFEIYISDYFGNTTNIGAYSEPLDQVLISEDLNNAIFRVDKSAIKSLYGDIYQSANSWVILRQYTYLKSEKTALQDDVYIRVQELINNEEHDIMYRYASSSDSYSSPTKWESVTCNSSYVSKINTIKDYYTNLIIQTNNEKNQIKNNFRFKKATIGIHTEGSTEWKLRLNTDIPMGSSSHPYIITICTESITDGIIRSYSFTADIRKIFDHITLKYGTDGNSIFSLNTDYSGNIVIKREKGTEEISVIYYQQTYKDYTLGYTTENFDNYYSAFVKFTSTEEEGGKYSSATLPTEATLLDDSGTVEITNNDYLDITVNVLVEYYDQYHEAWDEQGNRITHFFLTKQDRFVIPVQDISTKEKIYTNVINESLKEVSRIKVYKDDNDTIIHIVPVVVDENGNQDIGISRMDGYDEVATTGLESIYSINCIKYDQI